MKIPRRNDTQGINLQSNRSLTTGTAASTAVANLGKNVFDNVTKLAAQKTAHIAKLRQIEIETDKNNALSLLASDTSEFLLSLNDNDNYLAKPSSAFGEWEKKTKEWEKKYKGSLDEVTWKRTEAEYRMHLVEVGMKLENDYVNKQIVINGFKSLETLNSTHMQKVNEADHPKQILAHWEMYKNSIKAYDKILLGETAYADNYTKMEKSTNDAYVMYQATEGLITFSPKGERQVNWEGVEARLRNKETKIKDINGKELNREQLEPFIKDVDNRKTNQLSSHETERTELARDDDKQFTLEFIDIQNGKNDPNVTATFIERIKNSNMTTQQKEAHSKAFFTWQSKGIKPWETTLGKNSSTMANILIGHGLIDTETERSFLSNLFAQGLIKPDEYRTLNNLIDENIKKKNQHKNPLFNNAIRMISKELGDPELFNLLQNLKSGGTVDFEALLMNSSYETYEALNYFRLVLGEGEKQGFSYTEMLMDKTSKNYIMGDMMEFLKASHDGKITSDELTQNMLKNFPNIEAEDLYNKPYHVARDLWFRNKAPDIKDLPVPVRKDDESITAYLSRTQKYLLNMNMELPSTLSGYQFDSELDLNNLAIVPKIDD
jgi:hypothetical protein